MSLFRDEYNNVRIPAGHLAGFVIICTVLAIGSSGDLGFKPSDRGMVTAILLALPLGAICVGPVCRVSTGWAGKICGVLFFSCAFYLQVLHGLGSAVTARDSVMTVEKDIVGVVTSRHTSSGGYSSKTLSDDYRDRDFFYIESSDLAEHGFSKFRITEKEYKSLPRELKVHVILKKSFWGTIVKDYRFLSTDGKPISISQ